MNIKSYHKELKLIGCVICQNAINTHIHHCRSCSISIEGINVGRGEKINDWLVIPLCFNHHVGAEGIHFIGCHTWENRFNTQLFYLQLLSNLFGFDVFKKAGYRYDRILNRYEEIESKIIKN